MRTGARAATPLAFVVSAAIACFAAPAVAANPYAYGEVARFGGFDATRYDGGEYTGALTAGKFVDPTGFAVDTQDVEAPNDTALYVVDRTSGTNGSTTSWRLQKLNDKGEPLGVTTFTLSNETGVESAVVALAVDDTAGRVYALLAGNDELSELSYAKEIVAWSIHPEAGKLIAATAEGGGTLPSDPLHSTGGLISDEAQLATNLPGREALYNPQGLALDVTGGHRDLAIEATDDKGEGPSGVSGMPGSAVVRQVSTHTGGLEGTWSALTQIKSPAGEWEAAPRGISTNPDGSLTVLLGAAPNGISDVDVVKLSADLSSFQQLLDSENTSPDLDRAAAFLGPAPGPFAGQYVAQQPAAGPGLIQLSSGGLYAATFEAGPDTSDGESRNGSSFYWTAANHNIGDIANVGIRLLLPNQSGQISDPEGGTIANTLGFTAFGEHGEPIEGGVCNLDAEAQSLVAGANGSLWLLGAGVDTVAAGKGEPGGTLGREIVELAPDAGSACPQPSGGFTVSKSEVSAGSTVEFNAESVNLQHGVPFAYEWDLDNEGFKLVNKLGLWPRTEDGVTTEVISWPPSTATFKYTQPGQYTVKLRIVSEYGTYEAPSQTITVTEAKAPAAHFSVATANPMAGQQVSFSAGESSAFGGASLKNYHWEWGDGSSENVQSSPSATHTYATAGTYTVKLAVEDSNGLSSTVFAKEVTVVPAEEAHTTTTATASTSTHSETPPPNREPTSVTPQTSVGTGGVLKTTVSCPASKISCAGTVQVKTATAVAAIAKKGKKKPKKSQLVLGSTSFSLPGGTSETLTIHLTAQGMALLNKSKSLRVLVIISAHDSFGDPQTQMLSVTLRAPAKKSAHHAKH
jgi:PKD repeat protein